MDRNESTLEWLDRLREGVANHNAEAERQALVAEMAIRRDWGTREHTHVSGLLAGIDADTCAKCGLNFRDPIHTRAALSRARTALGEKG